MPGPVHASCACVCLNYVWCAVEQSEPSDGAEEGEGGAEDAEDDDEGGGESKGSKLEYDEGGIAVAPGTATPYCHDFDGLQAKAFLLLIRRPQTKWTQA